MPNVFLRDGEIRAILQAIEVSAAFWNACRNISAIQCVTDIFDDALISQKLLREKLEKFLYDSSEEV